MKKAHPLWRSSEPDPKPEGNAIRGAVFAAPAGLGLWALIFWWACSSSCGPTEGAREWPRARYLDDAEQGWFDATETAWAELYPAPDPDCVGTVLAAQAEDADAFDVACWVPPSKAASCLAGRVVVYAPGLELLDDGNPIVHEVTHLFAACTSGLSPDVYDYRHTIDELWRGRESVAARAQVIHDLQRVAGTR